MPAQILTVCGVAELSDHSRRKVSHVVTLLDPGSPEPAGLVQFDPHQRTIFHFHDIIEEQAGRIAPSAEIVADLLRLGQSTAQNRPDQHLLVHCHMGVSRSTATMLMLMAQANPDQHAEELFARLVAIRPQAWPNSRMVAMADEQLGRAGTLVAELRDHYGRQLVQRPEFHGWMENLGRGAELDMAR